MSAKEAEAIAIVFDIGNHVRAEDGKMATFFTNAQKCVSNILLRNLFSKSNNLLTVILAGSENTKSELEDEGGFRNIEVLSHFMKSDWGMISKVKSLEPTSVIVSWVNAVIVGIQCLRDKFEEIENLKKLNNRLTSKKLVLLSNFAGDVNDTRFNEAVNGIRNEQIELVIIGPEIFDKASNDGTEFDAQRDWSQSQKRAFQIYEMFSGENATFCTCDDALNDLKYFSSIKSNRTPWSVNMSIGPIQIPITGYKMLRNENCVAWKMASCSSYFNPSSENDPSTSNNNDDQVADEFRAESTELIRREQRFYVGENQVDKDNTIKGYTFGSTTVPVSKDDEESLLYQSGERGLTALFTVPREKIPMHLLITDSSAYYIVGSKSNEDAQKAISAFAHTLHDENLACVARKVSRSNSAVVIGALFPKVDTSPPALIFVELPFKDEIKKLWFPSLNKVVVSEEQLKAVDQLIDNMDFTEVFEEDEIPYSPENLKDPYEQYQLYCISQKVLQNDIKAENILADENIPLMPDYISELIQPLPEIVEKSKDAVKGIKDVFPLEVFEVKSGSNTKFGETTELYVSTLEGIKTEIDLDTTNNISDFFRSTLTVVGTINPVNDFTALLEKGEDFEKVSQQLQKVITELVRRVDNLEMLEKPLSCLKALRTGCIEKQRPDLYNNWMMSFKETVIDLQQKDFWDKVSKDHLGLILVTESDTSTISQENGDAFLRYESTVPQSNKNSMDIDDLLNDI